MKGDVILSKLDFCKKYIPILQMIEDDQDLVQACKDYSVYKNNNKHDSLMNYLYGYFMKEAYASGIVVTDYQEIIESAGLMDKVNNLPENILSSLSSKQILGCIAWHFRRDHFCEGTLISESIGEGHILRLMIKYVEKTEL